MEVFKKPLLTAVICAIILILPSSARAAEKPAIAGLTAIETTLVDGDATGYATFQSNNQKVVDTPNGIFMTHIRTRNDEYTAQQWRLSRSTDRGVTFSTVFEATNATNPPVIEADETGNIYLVRPDFVNLNAYLYRFLAEKNYTEPLISAIPGGSGGKYCMIFDQARKKLYYSAWGTTFTALQLDGTIEKNITLVTSGINADPQYPHFSIAPDGTLHMAWTTVKHNEYLYWDIHHMETQDAGATWTNMDGTKLTLPVKVDDSGPTDRITLDDEFNVHTWLSSFMEKDGKLHFAYNAQAPLNRQHYMRFDAKTGQREIDIQPEFKGTHISLASLDGFFAKRDSVPNGPLYYISSAGGKIGCLASDDNGTTWYDYGVSAGTYNAYSIGGCRSITSDGWIIGSFTDSAAEKVYFIRIKAGLAKVGVLRSTYEDGNFSAEFSDVYGQPESIRFSPDGLSWSGWTAFSPSLSVKLDSSPAWAQLKSRMGAVSDAFEISPTAPKPEWKTFRRADGLPDSLFICIAASNDGSVWATSQQGGVAHFDGTSWRTFTTVDGLSSNYVFSAVEGKDGAMWFGTYGSGAVRYDGSSMQVYNASNGMADVYVYAMAVEENGAVWFGSHYNGVSRFDGTNWKTYSTVDGLANNTVMAIAVDHSGAVWFGTQGSGISRFDGSTWKTYSVADGLLSTYVSSIAVGKDGAVWVGHYASGENKGGVSRFDGVNWSQYSTKDGLVCDYISTIAVSPNGDMWFGGYGGASRFDGKTFENYTTADGIGHIWTKSIAIDRNGAAWFATYGYDREGGITRYFNGIPLRVMETVAVPREAVITGNFPNPFNPATTIEFSLPRAGDIRVAIYSISGQRIRTLLTGAFPVGKHIVRWDGRDDAGREVSSGIYLAELRMGKARTAQRMTLVR